MKVSVKTGDTVIVNSGKDAGKKGKVLKVIRGKENVRVVVEGVNIVTKAKKAKTAQDKSELVKVEGSIDISNVNVVCPGCGKPVRIAHKVEGTKKFRVCSKCGAKLDTKFTAAKKDNKKAVKETEKSDMEKVAAATEKSNATTEKKSKTKRADIAETKATKTAEAKKPQTSRSAQRGV